MQSTAVKQKAGPKAGLELAIGRPAAGAVPASEAVVHAETDHVGLVRDLAVRAAAAGRGVARDLAEVDVKIFDLRRPVVEEGPFDAGARRPADVGLVDRSAVRRGALDVAECGATGDVGQEAVEGVADAAAAGAQPTVLGRAARGAAGGAGSAAGRRSVDPAGIDVTFQAEDEVAGLPVVAEGAAEQIFLGC